jgi:hypothetical protein
VLKRIDVTSRTLVTLVDAVDHPPQLTAQVPGQAPRRREPGNDGL